MITGYQFDRAKVPAIADSSLFSYLNSEQDIVIPNRGTQFEVTTQGLNLLAGTGQAVIQGRLVEILQTEIIAIPPSSAGYLVIKLDLALVNTSTGVPGTSDYRVINNQLSIQFVNQIINQDIHNGGTIRMLSLGSVSSSATTVTFVRSPNLSKKIIVADNIMLSTDIPWTELGSYIRYKRTGTRVSINVRYTSTTAQDEVILGILPANLNLRPPFNDLMFTVPSFSVTNTYNNHLQINTNNGYVALLQTFAGVIYAFQISFEI